MIYIQVINKNSIIIYPGNEIISQASKTYVVIM